MGYTHYFDLNGEITKEAIEDVKKVMTKRKGLIQLDRLDKSNPIVSENQITFNGIGEEGNEQLKIESNQSDFCKTERKAYDVVVCEVLLLLKHHLQDRFDFGSDGFSVSRDDYDNETFDGTWNEALANIKKEFGYTYEIEKKNEQRWYQRILSFIYRLKKATK